MIRPATHADAEAIARIYNHYIEKTVTTFEETPIDGREVISRMGDPETGFPWFVDQSADLITGYAYAGTWRTRAAFRHTAEISVYLGQEHQGKGLGSALYAHLIEAMTERGYNALVGAITLPNPASIALHERLGFQKVAHFTEVGYKFEQWIDVGFWQLSLRKNS